MSRAARAASAGRRAAQHLERRCGSAPAGCAARARASRGTRPCAGRRAQLVLDLLQVADVEVDADPRRDLAALVAHRHAARQHRVPLAVDAAEAVLAVPVRAVAHALLPGGERLGDVVGVEHVRPAEARALLLRQADEAQERLARVDVAARGVADPDAVVDRLADAAVEALARAQLGLRALPLLDLRRRAPVEPRVVDRDRRLRGDAEREALGPLGEDAGLGVAEEEARRAPRRRATSRARPGSSAPAGGPRACRRAARSSRSAGRGARRAGGSRPRRGRWARTPPCCAAGRTLRTPGAARPRA